MKKFKQINIAAITPKSSALKLNKETVAILSDVTLRHVAAGLFPLTHSGCHYTGCCLPEPL